MHTASTRVALSLSLALALLGEARAGEPVVLGRADAPIREVTVYTGRALVKRTASFEAKEAGPQKVVLAKLPPSVEGESLRVRSEAGTTLLGTRVVRRPVRESSLPARQENERRAGELVERKRAIEDVIAVHAATLAQVEKVRAAQASEGSRGLPAGGGERAARELAGLIAWAEGAQKAALDAKRAAEKDLREVSEALDLANRELAELSGDGRGDEQDVELELLVAKPGAVRLSVEYVTRGASWTPRYDLRADAEARTIEATYMGAVAQDTGEDWEGVKLALSTARPEIGARPPELGQVTLGQPVHANSSIRGWADKKPDARARFGGTDVGGEIGMEFAARRVDLPRGDEAMAASEARGATVAFVVANPETIPSDGKEKRTTIGRTSWKTENRYVTVPKLSPFAYLQCKVTNGFAYPLLAGEAAVYFGQDYVGKSRVDLVPAGEKLEVYLGVDERVRVERKTEKRFRDTKGVFSTDVRERYEYRIPIKNSRAEAIQITVIDQVPVSTHEDVRVEDVAWTPDVVPATEETKAPKGGKDDPTGERRWELVVPAKGEAAVTLGYTVRFPEKLEGAVAGLDR